MLCHRLHQLSSHSLKKTYKRRVLNFNQSKEIFLELYEEGLKAIIYLGPNHNSNTVVSSNRFGKTKHSYGYLLNNTYLLGMSSYVLMAWYLIYICLCFFCFFLLEKKLQTSKNNNNGLKSSLCKKPFFEAFVQNSNLQANKDELELMRFNPSSLKFLFQIMTGLNAN